MEPVNVWVESVALAERLAQELEVLGELEAKCQTPWEDPDWEEE